MSNACPLHCSPDRRLPGVGVMPSVSNRKSLSLKRDVSGADGQYECLRGAAEYGSPAGCSRGALLPPVRGPPSLIGARRTEQAGLMGRHVLPDEGQTPSAWILQAGVRQPRERVRKVDIQNCLFHFIIRNILIHIRTIFITLNTNSFALLLIRSLILSYKGL